MSIIICRYERWALFLSLLLLTRATISEEESSRYPYPFLKDAAAASGDTAIAATTISQYDYIIVGGGTAGCPLAATLSQTFKVLLVERGGVPYGNPNIERMDMFVDNLAQCNASSPAQAFVSEDGVVNRRARVLGGGTCLNAGFYSRASQTFITKSGWDINLVNQAYSWVERVVTFVPKLKQWQSAVRRSLLEVGVLPDNGVTYDHVVGTKTGGSIFDNTGHRHTAADLLQYANPNNIQVLIHATVNRILISKEKNAYGVEYSDKTGAVHQATLTPNSESEVIVSSGALGSPQLLMLSGIGPEKHLKKFSIPVIHHQPQVGKGMADNPMNAVFVPSPRPLEVSLVEVVGITSFGSFIESASARNVSGLIQPASALMISPATGMLTSVRPSFRTQELLESTQRELESMSKEAKSYFPRTGILMEKVDGPLSSGYLKLRNTNIQDNPIVRFNYFQKPEDLNRCIRGIQLIEKVIASPAMKNFRYDNINQLPKRMLKLIKLIGNLIPPNTTGSAEMGDYCKKTVTTIWHYHGGCQQGKVVDENYRVMGVNSLRVIDGSTFLTSPGTNPQATVMMLGRYMGLKILKEHSK